MCVLWLASLTSSLWSSPVGWRIESNEGLHQMCSRFIVVCYEFFGCTKNIYQSDFFFYINLEKMAMSIPKADSTRKEVFGA